MCSCSLPHGRHVVSNATLPAFSQWQMGASETMNANESVPPTCSSHQVFCRHEEKLNLANTYRMVNQGSSQAARKHSPRRSIPVRQKTLANLQKPNNPVYVCNHLGIKLVMNCQWVETSSNTNNNCQIIHKPKRTSPGHSKCQILNLRKTKLQPD